MISIFPKIPKLLQKEKLPLHLRRKAIQVMWTRRPSQEQFLTQLWVKRRLWTCLSKRNRLKSSHPLRKKIRDSKKRRITTKWLEQARGRMKSKVHCILHHSQARQKFRKDIIISPNCKMIFHLSSKSLKNLFSRQSQNQARRLSSLDRRVLSKLLTQVLLSRQRLRRHRTVPANLVYQCQM